LFKLDNDSSQCFDFLIKNYYTYDYTICTEFFIFSDPLILLKSVTTNDYNLLPSFKTYIQNSEYPDNGLFFEISPFSENLYWNEKIELHNFIFLKTSSFISFFINSNIDVPTCFKKSKSLSFKTFELPFIRFFNLIMRKGQRDKTIKFFFKKLLNRSNKWCDTPKHQFDYNQKIITNSIFFLKNYRNNSKTDIFDKTNNYLNLIYLLTFFEKNHYKTDTLFPVFAKNKTFEIKSSLFFKNAFLSLFLRVNSVFAYFIYNVDKNIRKYSRGKSGKYAFVWKYIAPYKRVFLAMRLFAKELKFRGERQFFERFLSSVSVLENDFKNSFIWQTKVFSHNYVFRNFKKTLLLSLKTMSK
jgi:hypothetical protein